MDMQKVKDSIGDHFQTGILRRKCKVKTEKILTS